MASVSHCVYNNLRPRMINHLRNYTLLCSDVTLLNALNTLAYDLPYCAVSVYVSVCNSET